MMHTTRWSCRLVHFSQCCVMAHRIPVSADDSQDPLNRMRVFQLAGELIPDCFGDARLVRAEPITEEIAGQLYAAVCSIEANISEAYSRSSGKDRAMRFEYALGSVRESMSWYKSATPSLARLRSRIVEIAWKRCAGCYSLLSQGNAAEP